MERLRAPIAALLRVTLTAPAKSAASGRDRKGWRVLLIAAACGLMLLAPACGGGDDDDDGGQGGGCPEGSDECPTNGCASYETCDPATCDCKCNITRADAWGFASTGCVDKTDGDTCTFMWSGSDGVCEDCQCKPNCPPGTPCAYHYEGESCQGPSGSPNPYTCLDCECVRSCPLGGECNWSGQTCVDGDTGVTGYCLGCTCTVCAQGSPCYDQAVGTRCTTSNVPFGECRGCTCKPLCEDQESACYAKADGDWCYDGDWGTCRDCDCLICPIGTACYGQNEYAPCTTEDEQGNTLSGSCQGCECFACPVDSPCYNNPTNGAQCVVQDALGNELNGICQDCQCKINCPPEGSVCYGLRQGADCTTEGGVAGVCEDCVCWEQACPGPGPCGGQFDGSECTTEDSLGNPVRGTCRDCECQVCPEGTLCYDKPDGLACELAPDIIGTCQDCECEVNCPPEGSPCYAVVESSYCTTALGQDGMCHDCVCEPNCPPYGSTCYGKSDYDPCITPGGTDGFCRNCVCCLDDSDLCASDDDCSQGICDTASCNCVCPDDSDGCTQDSDCEVWEQCDNQCNCVGFPLLSCADIAGGCTSDDDCAPGFCDLTTCTCVTARPVPPMPGEPCEESGDCSPGQGCLDGACVPLCDYNGQCDPAESATYCTDCVGPGETPPIGPEVEALPENFAYFSVFDCVVVEDHFEWYGAVAELDPDGEIVNSWYVDGPHAGPWRPMCPGGGSEGGEEGEAPSDGGDSCTGGAAACP